MAACKSCGGPKPKGRGRKFCDDCSVGCDQHTTMRRDCTDCHRKWYQADPARQQKIRDDASRSRKRRVYGLNNEELDELMSREQCAICESEDKLVIDHDHETGKVRDVLCHHCNVALGHVFDNPITLLKMIAYLKEHE